MTAKNFSCSLHKLGFSHSRRVYGNLVCTGGKNIFDVNDVSDASAYGERNGNHVRCSFYNIQYGASFLVGSGYVEENQLVCTLFFIDRRKLRWISFNFQIYKLHALDNFSVLDVEARNYSLSQHFSQPLKLV